MIWKKTFDACSTTLVTELGSNMPYKQSKLCSRNTVPRQYLSGSLDTLGAGIALLAGKTMTKRGFPLDTYVFSPPISSIPLEKLPGIDVVKHVFRIAECVFKVTLAALFDLPTQVDDRRIAAWTPYVYVNPSDIVCAEYIGLLKHKTSWLISD
ncbi:hypothetical protein Bca52824_061000 [Brassica carinata]|uniref:Uncharacterized protein n=1 Tax=Brassica carinata TaxID=52824 RepID=A0A8X7UG40_BRACI|nr:hypothetical protein Bca52824_061000 [Brassica carinata]